MHTKHCLVHCVGIWNAAAMGVCTLVFHPLHFTCVFSRAISDASCFVWLYRRWHSAAVYRKLIEILDIDISGCLLWEVWQVFSGLPRRSTSRANFVWSAKVFFTQNGLLQVTQASDGACTSHSFLARGMESNGSERAASGLPACCMSSG